MRDVSYLKPTRNKFESSWSLQIENNARLFLEYRTKYRVDKLAEGQWQVDWAFYFEGECKYFAEFRRRFVNHDQYKDLTISGSKIIKLRMLAREFCLHRSLLIVQFNDKLVSIDIGDYYEAGKLVPFGRAVGRDNKDTDPSVIIQPCQFKTIHNRCVSDDLSKRPKSNEQPPDVEGIRTYGTDVLRRMEQSQRIQRT